MLVKITGLPFGISRVANGRRLSSSHNIQVANQKIHPEKTSDPDGRIFPITYSVARMIVIKPGGLKNE